VYSACAVKRSRADFVLVEEVDVGVVQSGVQEVEDVGEGALLLSLRSLLVDAGVEVRVARVVRGRAVRIERAVGRVVGSAVALLVLVVVLAEAEALEDALRVATDALRDVGRTLVLVFRRGLTAAGGNRRSREDGGKGVDLSPGAGVRARLVRHEIAV